MSKRGNFFDDLLESVRQMSATIKEQQPAQATKLVNALVLGDHDEILWLAAVEAGVEWIEVAGAVDADEAPLNVRVYRVSASEADHQRALLQEQLLPLYRCEHQGRVYFTVSPD